MDIDVFSRVERHLAEIDSVSPLSVRWKKS